VSKRPDTEDPQKKTVGIGLAGFGTVGTGVWNILARNRELIEARAQGVAQLEIRRIAVRDLNRFREADAPDSIFTTDLAALIEDPEVEIVVELIGGTNAAFHLVAAALKAGKPVITGNKALLAECGAELFALSAEHNTPIHFEAAVAGAIPIIKAVQDSYIGNYIESFTGIINGTSNYILQRMTEAGLGYPEALAEAKDLGYAEADETLDVNGWDAAHKAILLASLAYGTLINYQDVYVRGIEMITPLDIKFAKELGYVVKLLSLVRHHPEKGIEIRTQPSFISSKHILASVNGVFNAIALKGDAAGESLFYGRGAGQEPTGSSVVADLVEAARHLSGTSSHRGFVPDTQAKPLLPIEETVTSCYVRFKVTDQPGVIAQIATILADEGIGISGTHSPSNPDDPNAEFVDLVFLLHETPFGHLCEVLSQIEALESVTERPALFRIETL